MTFVGLAVRTAFRNRMRTALTAFGVSVAVVAFLFLRTIIASFTSGVDNAAQDRLVTRSKVSVTVSLPMSYATKIRNVQGVDDLTWSSWFGGVYKDPKNFFPRFAVDMESYLRIYPEYVIPKDDKAALLGDRAGCAVGIQLAEKYGWKVGDVIHFQGDIYPGEWDFTVRAIYTGRERSTDTNVMFFHWKYLDERLPEIRRNQAGVFVFKVADPRRSTEVGRAIDEQFANSASETRTESERSFQLSFLSMTSAIVSAVKVVSIVMLVILTLILGNTMAMSTRERIPEYAVMRSIGFQPKHVVLLVLAEAVVVSLLGMLLGTIVAKPLVVGFVQWGSKNFGAFLRGTELSAGSIVGAAGASLIGGLLATAWPAVQAGRLKIIEALRQVE